ncbi:hypothetical protein [Roseibacillus ishigakijimensis]|uniref:Uncharacterized protein n=1 Tax=Roseibacillus ishigakijimensis TaxID=454146 RepID=A0A934VGS1_9BACT|nr:hypothetical protein [Roseibacillus ishigakijimensis]MBK1833163.1 hypothetical protein [Roseibacillus ishigakijimensis]
MKFRLLGFFLLGLGTGVLFLKFRPTPAPSDPRLPNIPPAASTSLPPTPVVNEPPPPLSLGGSMGGSTIGGSSSTSPPTPALLPSAEQLAQVTDFTARVREGHLAADEIHRQFEELFPHMKPLGSPVQFNAEGMDAFQAVCERDISLALELLKTHLIYEENLEDHTQKSRHVIRVGPTFYQKAAENSPELFLAAIKATTQNQNRESVAVDYPPSFDFASVHRELKAFYQQSENSPTLLQKGPQPADLYEDWAQRDPEAVLALLQQAQEQDEDPARYRGWDLAAYYRGVSKEEKEAAAGGRILGHLWREQTLSRESIAAVLAESLTPELLTGFAETSGLLAPTKP